MDHYLTSLGDTILKLQFGLRIWPNRKGLKGPAPIGVLNKIARIGLMLGGPSCGYLSSEPIYLYAWTRQIWTFTTIISQFAFK